MAVELFIPKMGQTVEEVTIVSWLVEDGARVEPGQAVLEVETDKAVFPVDAVAAGFLHRGPFKEGDVIPVLTTVAVVGAPGERFPAEGLDSARLAAPTVPSRKEPPAAAGASAGLEMSKGLIASPRARRLAAEKKVDLRKVQPTGAHGTRITEQDVLDWLDRQPRASPLAQKVAAETGVDLISLAGTGPGGRIMKKDVARGQSVGAPAGEQDVIERILLKGVRAVIADRMSVSVHTAARVTLVSEVDATELVAMRARLKERVADEWGFAPGFNDFLAKIVAAALRKYPYMNARLTTDAIEYLKPVNLGMAVDTGRGLLVPVIRNVDQKSLRQFGLEFRELAARARGGKSLPDDLTGGTFTITNLGSFGVDAFTPVINLPEAAILGMGRIAPKVVPRADQAVIRHMCTLSLAFDHRLVDGAPAARFLKYIGDLIEEPYLLVSVLQE